MELLCNFLISTTLKSLTKHDAKFCWDKMSSYSILIIINYFTVANGADVAQRCATQKTERLF